MSENGKNNKFESYARKMLIDCYIKALEEDTIPWQKGWSSVGRIHNAISKHKYRGVNALLLNFVSSIEGYKDPRWCTFTQANKNGWSIKAGEKSVPIEFWMPYDLDEKRFLSWKEYNDLVDRAKHTNEELHIKMGCKIFRVWNAEQIKGIPPLELELNEINSEEFIDKLIEKMGVGYEEKGDMAYYVPSYDKVRIPLKGSFDTDYDYNSTRLHELAHATGHKIRLNRNLEGEFGSESYAKEELRAEIASSFISQSINLKNSPSHIESHKAYIQNWIKILKKDPNELFKAIKEAEMIEDYVYELVNGEREIVKEIDTSESVLEKLKRDEDYCKDVFNLKEKIVTDLYNLGTLDEEVLDVIINNFDLYNHQILDKLIEVLSYPEYQDIKNDLTVENAKELISSVDNLYIDAIELAIAQPLTKEESYSL